MNKAEIRRSKRVVYADAPKKEYIERGRLLELETFLQDADGFECSAVLSVDIRSAKAADVVEVKHGRWIEKCVSDFDRAFATIFVCSECEKRYRVPNMNYCPKCGAKMDGGAE